MERRPAGVPRNGGGEREPQLRRTAARLDDDQPAGLLVDREPRHPREAGGEHADQVALQPGELFHQGIKV